MTDQFIDRVGMLIIDKELAYGKVFKMIYLENLSHSKDEDKHTVVGKISLIYADCQWVY